MNPGSQKQGRGKSHLGKVCGPHALGVLLVGGGAGVAFGVPQREAAVVVGRQQQVLDVGVPHHAAQLGARRHLQPRAVHRAICLQHV